VADEIATASTARERVLAAAAQIAVEGSGPVTGVALAVRANVSPATVSRLRAAIAQKSPGVLSSLTAERARILAAAAQIGREGLGPVTPSALATRAKVAPKTVYRMRDVIEAHFPSVLGLARERVLAAAERIVRERTGPVTQAALAAEAHTSQCTISRLHLEIWERVPGALIPPLSAMSSGPGEQC
jgi:hypothetical protein